jgi:hypothetical protein
MMVNFHNLRSARNIRTIVALIFSSVAPALGTNGTERTQQFRCPSFAETDLALIKNTHIGERANLELRFEFYNLFNHPNINNVDTSMTDAQFGQARGQRLPMWIQFAARLSF